MTNPPLRLKKDQDRRVRAGHLWIYSNEVDTDKTPFDQFEPGQVVAVENAQGKWQGLAYVNPNSLICARLVTRQRDLAFDGSLFVHRIKVALSLRERLYHAPYYRLIFGEGDALPGVVVDRYGDYLVVQITTAGMECHKDAVLAMYHDQGLPVLKHMGFGRAVNITLGLPIIRTSVDHGTAYDLACTGDADPGSLQAALQCAIDMIHASTRR